MRITEQLVAQLGDLMTNYPACNARCHDVKGEHATLMWIGQALGTPPPDDRELAATFRAQLAAKGAEYLGHEYAPEAPPPDGSWNGNLYLVRGARRGPEVTLAMLPDVPPDTLRTARDGAFRPYLVRWFFPIPFGPIRTDYARYAPEDAAALGFAEKAR